MGSTGSKPHEPSEPVRTVVEAATPEVPKVAPVVSDIDTSGSDHGSPETVEIDDEAAAVAKELGEFGTLVFGREDCSWTRRQRQAFGKEDFDKHIHYIQCDGTPEEVEVCEQVGVESVPLWVIGGEPLVGFRSVKQLKEEIATRDDLATRLKAASAKLYGSEKCIWTQRQKLLFGPSFDKIDYVRCDTEEGLPQCQEAGIEGVPTWTLGKTKRTGYHRVPGLEELLASNE